MVTDVTLDEALRRYVTAAAEAAQDVEAALPLEERHPPPPTPSVVMHCLLQQWLKAKGYPTTNRRSAATEKRLESGRAIEPFWRDTYDRLGFDVHKIGRIPVTDMNGTEPDGILVARNKAAASLLGLDHGKYMHGIGNWCSGCAAVLELKDMGVWQWLKFHEQGAALGVMEYYHQVQLVMEATGLKVGILHGGIADPSALKFIWSRIKRREGRPPPLWTELIYPDEEALRNAHERAITLNYDLGFDEIPWHLQEHNPDELVPKEGFPCFYCEYANCNDLARKETE